MTFPDSVSRRKFLAASGGALLLDAATLANAQPASGRTLTVALPNNPITADPINQLNHDSMILGQTVFENLVEFGVDGVLRPQLAMALPVISDDKKSYTFDLRDDVVFHDGKKLDAEDVKYSFDYLLDPANKALRRPIFARIAKVTALDPLKVRIDLSEPYGPWLYFLTKYMGIFPKGSREKYGDAHFKQSPSGVGTGVGIFEEWKPNDSVTFRRNPNHWQKGVPQWDRLVVRFIPEDATRVAYLVTGQADIISAPPPREFNRLKTMPGVTGGSQPTLGGALILYSNNQKPPLDDVNVRKAISCAIDRKTIGEKVYFGLLEPSAMLAPPRGWWFDAAAERELAFDLDKAKALMAQSRYPSGGELDLSVQSEVYLLDTKDAALFIQAQLAKIGIKVNMKVYETSVLTQQVARGEHTMAMQMFMSPGEPTYIIQSTLTPGQSLSKSSNYTSPELEGLMREAYAETDEAKLKGIYGRIQQLIARDAPSVYVGFVHASNLWRQTVKDFRVSPGLTMNVAAVKV